MSRATFFVQECPTCGRRLEVRVEYLGKAVVCQHCRGQFEAKDPAAGNVIPKPHVMGILERVDQLLASANEQRLEVR